jgi:hypothetical protein
MVAILMIFVGPPPLIRMSDLAHFINNVWIGALACVVHAWLVHVVFDYFDIAKRRKTRELL